MEDELLATFSKEAHQRGQALSGIQKQTARDVLDAERVIHAKTTVSSLTRSTTMTTDTRQKADTTSDNTAVQPSVAAVVRKTSDDTKDTNLPTKLSEGRSRLGQLIVLKAGAKVAINTIALEMVRPDDHVDAVTESIAEVGQLTPCVLIQLAKNSYQLLAGVTRKTACDTLGIACNCVVLDEMTIEQANDWVAQEREANRNQRSLNAAQKALDGARLCKEVYEPAAKLRKQQGKAAVGEAGESSELAARACGISAASVKAARKILGTPAEQLVKEGLLKTLSTGKKLAELPPEQQEAAVKAYRAGCMEEFQDLIGEAARVNKDKRGVEIPNGSPLLEVFKDAEAYDKQVATIGKVAESVRELRSSSDVASDELNAVDLEKLQSVADQIAAARPYALCPVCEAHGKDTKCEWCHGRRWLTAKRTGQFEAAQQEAIKKIRPK